jgi:hypothetical protein
MLWLESHSDTMGRSRKDEVAWFQCHHAATIAHKIRAGENHTSRHYSFTKLLAVI